mmetsp:Transcript_13790/g.15854  ORF Transcript_13790/g.15854 Transcript_13790/m.15854 type:complete len:329 (-) Transcript_13790:41-1027(-)
MSQQSSTATVSSSVVVVDCGSGYTRVTSFNFSADTTLIHAVKSSSNISALHTVIHCPDKSHEWIKQLIPIIEELHPFAPDVFLGGTGGVRALISQGRISSAEVYAFQQKLENFMELSFEANFRILSGDDEAKYEFMAADYCGKKCGFFDSSNNKVGLLSSGGMSSQIYVDGKAHSLETATKIGNAMGVEHGMRQAIADFKKRVSKIVQTELPENYGGDNILYFAVELLAGAGEKAGMGSVNKTTVSDAIHKFTNYINKNIDEEVLESTTKRTWRDYVYVMNAVVGVLILQRLHPNSEILFCREFELREDHVLKVSWPLGYAIQTLTKV